MTKWLHSEQKLIENDTNAPNINLRRDLRVLALVETLGSLVPVRAYALTRQFNLILILLDDFTQAEVGDFHLTVVEDNVLRLQVVMDDFLLLIVQVFETGEDL